MRRIFYLTCALIAYGSLYPFQFVARQSPFGVLAVFASSLHVRPDRGEIHDLLVNLLVYIPVGFFFVLDERHHKPAWRRCLNATLAGAALSLCMETAQYWDLPRSPSLIDLAMNAISAALGGVLGVIFARQARHAFDSLSETVLGHPSSALFLGILWIAALFTPGDWARPGAISHVRAMLAGPYLAPGHILVSFSHWLGISSLLAAVLGRSRTPAMLLAAALVLPIRFLIPGQHPEIYEFEGAAAALLVWYVPFLQKRLSTGRIAMLLVLGLCIDGLRPWNFSGQAAAFQWIPFVSMLDSPDWAPTLLVLFRKAAVYGTAVWAVARAGFGMLGGSIFTGVVLGFLEIAQIYLPGRTAETSDPLLALIVGVILLHFDHKFGADLGVSAALQREQTASSQKIHEGLPEKSGTAPESGARSGNAVPRPSGPWTGGRRPGL